MVTQLMMASQSVTRDAEASSELRRCGFLRNLFQLIFSAQGRFERDSKTCVVFGICDTHFSLNE
jgi:hypothetical protein